MISTRQTEWLRDLILPVLPVETEMDLRGMPRSSGKSLRMPPSPPRRVARFRVHGPRPAGGRNVFRTPVIRTVLMLLFLVVAAAAESAGADDAVTLSLETQGLYDLGPGDSETIGRKLAGFRARRAAADQAAGRFARNDLIQFVDRDRSELVDLVADNLRPRILEDKCSAEGRAVTCKVRALTVVRLSDFIRAQLTSLRLGAAEKEAGYRDEMEPRVADPLRPGQVLARVRRLIDQHEPRMAVIYIDRLIARYPNWREIYEAKAAALRLQNRPERMRAALSQACKLGSSEACSELKQ